MKSFRSSIFSVSSVLQIIWLAASCLVSTLHETSTWAEAKYFSVMQYNVENLFDPNEFPGKRDKEYTPDGKKKWTEEKLDQKLENLTQVVRSINNGNGPSLIGLVEVEHIGVLERWSMKFMSDLGYQPVLIPGPDARGINVAILTKFPMLRPPVSISVSDSSKGRPTRDVLLATLDVGGMPLYMLVNHWPSRLGGKHACEYRMEVAKKVYYTVTKILEKDPAADILITGDFNDEPEDLSIKRGLHVTSDLEKVIGSQQPLFFSGVYDFINLVGLLKNYDEKFRDTVEYNPAEVEAKARKARGSYFYSGDKKWYDFDQIIMNANLFDNERVKYYRKSFRIVRLPFMLDKNGTPKKFEKYQPDGYSDHLPVTARFSVSDL